MNIIPMSTQFLYEFYIDQNLVDKSLEYFLNLDLKSIKTVKNENSVESLNLDEPIISLYHKELFDEIQKYVDQVASKHFRNQKFAICDSWLTRSKFGQDAMIHSHTFSIFSGLLYMTDQEHSHTVFHLDDPFYEKYKYLFGSYVNKIPYEFHVQPKKGKLILWDSSLRHRIGRLPEKNTRYTLAFNTWLTGEICNDPTSRLISNVVDVAEVNQKK